MSKIPPFIDSSDFIKTPFLKALYKIIRPLVDRSTGLHQLAIDYHAIKGMGADTPSEFAQNSLKYYRCEVEFRGDMIEQLRAIEGPILIASNHPYGCIDAMALMVLLEKIKPGQWKLFANKTLRTVDALKTVSLEVDPFADKSDNAQNMGSLKQALRTLKKSGAVGMFPARRVSAFDKDLDAVLDLEWSEHALKIASAANAHLAIIHMGGQNSDSFLNIPTDQITKRALAIPKEVGKQAGSKLPVSLSAVIPPAAAKKMSRLDHAAEQLRAYCYLGSEKDPSAKNSLSKSVDYTRPDSDIDAIQVEIEVMREKNTILKLENFILFLFKGKQSPTLLREIGIGRAQTFAAIGAGAGNQIDLAPEDEYYHHLTIWDEQSQSVIGAYRIGFLQEIIAERGTSGVYLDHVFKIDADFYKHIGNAMELSRSYILPNYQKHPQLLDALWKGLAIISQKHDCHNMFGAVTISDTFSTLSQDVLVDTLDRFHSDSEELRSLIEEKYPYEYKGKYYPLISDAWRTDGINRLNTVIETIEHGEKSIPPLIRYYISLGAKFLAFNPEPSFNNAIYCLLRVDLSKIPQRFRKRLFK